MELGEFSKFSDKQDTIETRLAEMAADKEIQAELRKINEGFSLTELDGNRIFMFPAISFCYFLH